MGTCRNEDPKIQRTLFSCLGLMKSGQACRNVIGEKRMSYWGQSEGVKPARPVFWILLGLWSVTAGMMSSRKKGVIARFYGLLWERGV